MLEQKSPALVTGPPELQYVLVVPILGGGGQKSTRQRKKKSMHGCKRSNNGHLHGWTVLQFSPVRSFYPDPRSWDNLPTVSKDGEYCKIDAKPLLVSLCCTLPGYL